MNCALHAEAIVDGLGKNPPRPTRFAHGVALFARRIFFFSDLAGSLFAGYRFLNQLCWANTLVYLLFGLSKLALLSKWTVKPVAIMSHLGVLSFTTQQIELCQSSTDMNYVYVVSATNMYKIYNWTFFNAYKISLPFNMGRHHISKVASWYWERPSTLFLRADKA